ncbi:hypothetical protein [uncultured Cyclobacterium sp.]|uniref:hypothetical protein n=1 Tax=uncultured Cyclobacterium sp. TaxID=453820 RepID=UPI0030ED130C
MSKSTDKSPFLLPDPGRCFTLLEYIPTDQFYHFVQLPGEVIFIGTVSICGNEIFDFSMSSKSIPKDKKDCPVPPEVKILYI